MSPEPRYAVNEWSTPHNSVVQDIEQIARTGGQAIGLFGGKFRDREDALYLEALERHGLVARCGPFCRRRSTCPASRPTRDSGPS